MIKNTWITDYVINYTKDSEAPESYHIWVAISVIAAALERKVWVEISHQKIYPNLFMILVGDPGDTRKSSALKLGQNFISLIPTINKGASIVTPAQLVMNLAEVRKTYTVDDSKIITQCPLTLLSFELSSIFLSDPGGMIELLTNLFDAQIQDLFDKKTKNSGCDEVIGPWLNIIGATTPSFFQNDYMIKGVGTGFTSRCIFVFENEVRFRRALINTENHRQNESDEDRGYVSLLNRLNKIHDLQGEFIWDKQSGDFYKNWYENLPKKLEVSAEILRPYYNRRGMHLAKIALILAASELEGKNIIRLKHIKKAFKLIKHIEGTMINVFSKSYKNVHAGDAQTILKYLESVAKKAKNEKDFWVDRGVLIEKFMFDMESQIIKQSLDDLVEAGSVERNVRRGTGKLTFRVKKDKKDA